MPISLNSAVGRAVTKMAGSAPFLRVAPWFVPHLDRVLHRLTGGRVVMSSAMVPSLVLTCTGAKSGQPRVIPLACLPDDDGSFLVVGSNFGRPDHPAWTANLLAHPAATASFRGRAFPVTARLLDAEETAAVWPRLLAVWPNYDAYRAHAGGRPLRVFRLSPTPR